MTNTPLPPNLGPYRLGARLGATALGECFAAEDTRDASAVSITVVRAELAADAAWREQLTAATERLGALSAHPHVQALREVGEEAGRLYLVAAPYERTLRAESAVWADDLARGLRLLAEAAQGLEHAHAGGVVHGQMRPEALLIAASGALLVEMPGLAALDPDASAAAVTYRSPEQCRGEAPSPASDIYALGVILYELASGVAPFTGANADAVASKHRNDEPPPPMLPEIAGAAQLETLITSCLAKSLSERPPSAAAVAEALTAILEPRPVEPPRSDTQLVEAGPSTSPPLPGLPPATRGIQVEAFDARGARLALRELTGQGLSVGSAEGAGLKLIAEGIAPRHAQIRLFWKERRATVELAQGARAWLGGVSLPEGQAAWNGETLLQIGACWLRLVPPQAVTQPTSQPTLAPQLPPPAPSPQPATATPSTATATTGAVGSSLAMPATSPAATSATVAVAEESALQVVMERDTLILEPGAAAPQYLGMTLTNGGRRNAQLSFDIALVQQPDHSPGKAMGVQAVRSWIIERPDVTLGPQKSAQVRLPILVPKSADNRAGVYIVKLLIRNTEGAGAQTLVTWVVKPFMQSHLSVDPEIGEGWFGATYGLALKNEGNATIDYALTAGDHSRQLWSSPREASLRLKPLEQSQVRMWLHRPLLVQLMRGREHSLLFRAQQLYAEPKVVGEAGERSETLRAKFLHRTILPAWLATLLAILVLAFVAWLLRPPSINTLSVQPTVGIQGSPVALAIKLSDNASRGEILIPPSMPITFTRQIGGGDQILMIPYSTTLPREVEVRAYNPYNPFLPASEEVTLPFVTATPVAQPTTIPTMTATPCPQPQIVEFRAIPESVLLGDTAILTWTIVNAESIYISKGIERPVPGEEVLISPEVSTSYELTAFGCNDTIGDKKIAAIEVIPIPESPPPADLILETRPTLPTLIPSLTPTALGRINCPQFTRILVEGGPRVGPAGAAFLIYFRERQVGGGSLDRNGAFRTEIEVLRERGGDYPITVRLRDTNQLVPVRLFTVDGGTAVPLPAGAEIVCQVPSPTPRVPATPTPRG